MDSKPLISVLVPTYNCADTLVWSICSLLCQTYEYWEAVIVDDGSTDNTEQLVKAFQDPRIRYFKLGKNYGRPYARQIALDSARGEVVCMLDADDWCVKNRLEQQLSILQKKDIVLVSSEMIVVDNENNIIGVTSYHKRNTVFPPHPASMFKKYVLDDFSFDMNQKRGEDYDLMETLLDSGDSILMETPLYVYRNAFQGAKKLSSAHYYNARNHFRYMFQKPGRALLKGGRSLLIAGYYKINDVLNRKIDNSKSKTRVVTEDELTVFLTTKSMINDKLDKVRFK